MDRPRECLPAVPHSAFICASVAGSWKVKGRSDDERCVRDVRDRPPTNRWSSVVTYVANQAMELGDELLPRVRIASPWVHSPLVKRPRRAPKSQGAARRRDRVPLGAMYSGGGGLQSAAR